MVGKVFKRMEFGENQECIDPVQTISRSIIPRYEQQDLIRQRVLISGNEQNDYPTNSHPFHFLAKPNAWVEEFQSFNLNKENSFQEFEPIFQSSNLDQWKLDFSTFEERLLSSEYQNEWDQQFMKMEAQLLSDSSQWTEEFNPSDIKVESINTDLDDTWNRLRDHQWDSSASDLINESEPLVLLREYIFEENNPFLTHKNPMAEGIRLFSTYENLTYASLAFEAAIQRDINDSKAWEYLGLALLT
jgi:hypothetical protein